MSAGLTRFATSRVWNVEDFSDVWLGEQIKALTGRSVVDVEPASPGAQVLWEAGMATAACLVCGIAQPDLEILALGANMAPAAYWLSRFARRVFSAMGDGPAAFVPEPAAPRRVVPQALDDAFAPHDDGVLGAVLAGSDVPVTPALLDEAFRVLMPGGVLALALTLDGPPEQVVDELVGDRPWSLVSTLESDRSDATQATELPVLAHFALLKPVVADPSIASGSVDQDPEPDPPGRFLAGHLPDRIVFVDAGARWGFAERWVDLAPHIRLIGFEPDPDECSRLTRMYAGRIDATLLPLGLGAKGETVEFRITRIAAGSSRFTPNLDGTSHFRYEPGAEVVDTVDVDFVALDRWCTDNAIDRVDAMKLDIEGGELDALRGSVATLRHVRALEIEVKFAQLNVGEPLYGDIAGFLRDHGFALWCFRDMAHYHLKTVQHRPRFEHVKYFDSEPLALSLPAAQLTWGNAIFVAEDAFREAGLDWRQRLRDATVFDAMELSDLAIHSLQELLAHAELPEDIRSAATSRVLELTNAGDQ